MTCMNETDSVLDQTRFSHPHVVPDLSADEHRWWYFGVCKQWESVLFLRVRRLRWRIPDADRIQKECALSLRAAQELLRVFRAQQKISGRLERSVREGGAVQSRERGSENRPNCVQMKPVIQYWRWFWPVERKVPRYFFESAISEGKDFGFVRD